jgi:hypothetical protein
MWTKNTLFVITLSLGACSTYQPHNTNNLCHIFLGDVNWYESAIDAQKRWGTPVHVLMAIMHQESRFVADAQPKRPWFLGVIPLPRRSSAFGYAQAQDPAWNDYMRYTKSWGADRDDFHDAIDFIGWYTFSTQKQLKISKWDTYKQYLAYHEGRGGYTKKTYKKKPWLIQVAHKVRGQSIRYNRQLKGCKKRLDHEINGWF